MNAGTVTPLSSGPALVESAWLGLQRTPLAGSAAIELNAAASEYEARQIECADLRELKAFAVEAGQPVTVINHALLVALQEREQARDRFRRAAAVFRGAGLPTL